MKLRLFVLLAVVLASASASAGTIDPTFQFTNTSGGPVSRADFAIIPAGSVQAPVIGTDPVTGLPKTASPVTLDVKQSNGFDPTNFSTALGTGTGIQGLRLLFGQKQVVQNGTVVFQPVYGPNGELPRYLDNGGTVTFSLHLDPAFVGTVSLKSLTAGINDPKLLPDSGTGSGSGTPLPPAPPELPEPAALMLWGVVALALGAVRFGRPWHPVPARA